MNLLLAAISFLRSSPAALELGRKLMGHVLGGDRKKAFVAHQVKTYQGIAKELGRAVAIFHEAKSNLSPEHQVALGIMYDSVLEKIDEGMEACQQFEELGIDPNLISEAIADAKTRMEIYAGGQDRVLAVRKDDDPQPQGNMSGLQRNWNQ